MATLWRYIHSSVYGASSDNSDKPYDEERLDWGPRSCCRSRRGGFRIPRLKKATAFLLFVDLIVVVLLLQAFNPLITLLCRNEELFGPQVVFSDRNISDSKHQAIPTGRIPRILHQTTANDTIPEKWVLSQQSCKKAYSGFEYKLWTDESARNFLADQYPWFVDIWDNYAFPIQRADAIRYFVLYHYGGIYLDMDTWCNETIPIRKIDSDAAAHHAIFKSTLPTGITNDFMIASARHPAYAAAIAKLPLFNTITRPWAEWQPYSSIMISSGPMFLTMVVKDYLMEQPSLPSPTVAVVNATELEPYITDLESSSWHHSDATALMWIGHRPWTWFSMGAVGLAVGLYVFNHVLMVFWEFFYGALSGTYSMKLAKVA